MTRISKAWEHRLDWRFDGAFLEVVDGTIVVQVVNANLDLDLNGLSASGRAVWKIENVNKFFSFRGDVFAGGSRARRMQATTGAVLAELDLGCDMSVRRPTASGPIYAVKSPPKKLALDPETLAVLWEWMDPTGEYVVFDKCLVRFRESGELTLVSVPEMEAREVRARPRATIGALLGLWDNLLCEFPMTEGGRRATDIHTGERVWEFSDPPVYWSTVFDGGVAYAGGSTGVSCYELTSGQQVWRQSFGQSEVGMRSNLRLIRGRLYLGLHDGSIRVLDAATGDEVLKYRTGAEVEAVTALDENHLVFATKNLVTCLNVH